MRTYKSVGIVLGLSLLLLACLTTIEHRARGADGFGPPPGNVVNQPFVGEVKFLFIILEYPLSGAEGEAVTSPEDAAAHGAVVAESFTENSFGLANVTVDVTPGLAMPRPLSYYQDHGVAPVRADAVVLAERAGFTIADYDREAIFTQKYWSSGSAALGTINNRTMVSISANPSDPHLSMHEFGHSLGFRHANFWQVFTDDPLSPDGEQLEYGDRFDVMGGVWSSVEESRFGPTLRQRAGWIAEANIRTVTESGIFVLQPLEEIPQDKPAIYRFTALRIPRDSQTNYWVFFRGDQATIDYGPVITKSYNRNTIPSLLYDMTPGSLPDEDGQVLDWQDAALPVGEIFWDVEVGIEVENLASTPDQIEVRVWVDDAIALIDKAPIIGVVSPARGVTVEGVVEYEATAFDPDVLESNGAGIANVALYLHPLDDALIQALRDQGDPPSPVATIQLTAPPYLLSVDTAVDSTIIPDAVYALVVTATDDQGMVNTVWFPHIIDNTGPYIPGDFDSDGDIDLDDFAVLADCVAGPEVVDPPDGCGADSFAMSDLDGDADVDMHDLAAFQSAFTGPEP